MIDENYKSSLEANELSVVKSNILIQKSRHNLSMQQQKILLYVISLIEKEDTEFKLYEFDVREFCDLCNISYAGTNYTDVKKALKDISDKSFWLKLDNGIESLVRWIEKAYIDPSTSRITVKLNDDLKPYLLQLKDHYTQYALKQVLRLDSKYAIRLYEFISSIHYYDTTSYEKDFSVDYIRTVMGADGYVNFKDFNSRALQPALKEINAKSDKKVECHYLKKRNKVVGLEFCIEQNNENLITT